MTEEERLELTSAVEDEFSEPLERLEDALEDADDAIRDAGRGIDTVEINVDVDGVARAAAELETVNEQLEDLNDNIGSVDIGDMGSGGQVAMTSGGREGDLENTIDDDLDMEEAFEERGMTDLSGRAMQPLKDIPSDDDRPSIQEQRDAVRMLEGPTVEVDGEQVDRFSVEAEMDQPDLYESRNRDGMRDTGGKLLRRFKDLHFTMGTFHSLVAGFLPLFGVFIGAVPAAITAVGALAGAAIVAAGALAGIGALGLGGMMLAESGGLNPQSLMQRMESVFDSFVDAFAPLMKSFAPLMDTLISDIEAMAGPLATASTELLAFRDTFSGMASFVTTLIPNLVGDLLAFSNAAMPLVDFFTSMISFRGTLDFLANFLADNAGHIAALVRGIRDMIPFILFASEGFFFMAAAIIRVIGGITDLLARFPIVAKAIGGVTAAILALATGTTLFSLATSSAIIKTLTLARMLVARGVLALVSYASSMSLATAATLAFAAAAGIAISIVTLGLGPLLSFASGFNLLGGNISDATKELKRFNSLAGVDGTPSLGANATPARGSGGIYQDNSTTVINAGDKDSAARQTYASEFERRQHVDSVFGN